VHSLDEEEVDDHLRRAIKENAHKCHSSVLLEIHHTEERILASSKIGLDTNADLENGCGRDKGVRIDIEKQDDCSHWLAHSGDVQETYASEDTTSFATTRLFLF
jgi:hypothetical protein